VITSFLTSSHEGDFEGVLDQRNRRSFSVILVDIVIHIFDAFPNYPTESDRENIKPHLNGLLRSKVHS